MILDEKDILEVYKEEGSFKEYYNCQKYLEFQKLSLKKKSVRRIAKDLNVKYGTLLHWNRGERTPVGIKAINFLKKKGLIPFKTSERVARIVGFLHGDGYLYSSLTHFGFASSEREMLKKINKDITRTFKVTGKIEKFREKGEKAVINSKTTYATKPTYHLEYGPKALCHVVYKLGVPKGKRIYVDYSIPDWIKGGSKEVKRGFLQGLFDSELANASISSYGSHKENLGSPRMEMGKHSILEESLKRYLGEISKLLEVWRVASSVKYPKEYRRKRISYNLLISNRLQNMENLIKRVGFYYSGERKKEAQHILNLIRKKKKKAFIAKRSLKTDGWKQIS